MDDDFVPDGIVAEDESVDQKLYAGEFRMRVKPYELNISLTFDMVFLFLPFTVGIIEPLWRIP